MRTLIVIASVLLGCRDRGAEPPASPSDPVAAITAPQVDPWATTAGPDDLPDLAERQRLAEQACPAVTAPYFFRIEKAGKVSHILGTRHIGVSLAKFPRVVHDRLADAKLAVFEVAPDDPDESEFREYALADELGPELWERYRKLVGTRVARSLEHAAPAEALLTLTLLHEDTGAMLDLEIEDAASHAKIPTHGLESGAFQLQLLERHLDLRMLRATILLTENRAELAEDSRTDLADYCAGSEVDRMMEKSRKDLMEAGYTKAEVDLLEEEMIFARNARWIPRLETMLATGDAFIAVGAAHVQGPRGVPALLAARGYHVTRIKP